MIGDAALFVDGETLKAFTNEVFITGFDDQGVRGDRVAARG